MTQPGKRDEADSDASSLAASERPVPALTQGDPASDEAQAAGPERDRRGAGGSGWVASGADSRRSLESSVFLTQLLLAAGVLLLVVIDFTVTGETSEPLYFAGVAGIFALTAVAAVVRWSTLPQWAIAVIPLLDIGAIMLVREGRADLGASVFMVFPVIWLATHFGAIGATIGPVVCAVALWFSAIGDGQAITSADLPRLLVIPVVLVFVSTSAYLTTKRTKAQRVLLARQAVMLEGALARARRQERTLDEILNAVTFGVVGVDADNRPLIVNRTYREWVASVTGDDNAIVPTVVYDQDGVTPLPDAERPYRRLLEGETFDDEVVWTGAPGERRRAIAVTGRQLYDEDGRREGAVLVSRDITELVDSIKARDDLVSSVSHELRTPLTSLLGYLELVQDDADLSHATRSHVEVASKNADRLIAIVSDFLAAKSDGGTLLMSFAPCDLAAVAKQAVQSFQPLAIQRLITFTFTAKGDTTVEADAFRVRQIIDNLLSNAVKYNDDNGAVSVRVVGEDGHVEIRVSDTGRGMTSQEQSRIFERFYRAESVRKTSVHGTGLGLAISRDMARQHGGELYLESSGPHGTTMVLSLPRHRDRSHDGGASDDA